MVFSVVAVAGLVACAVQNAGIPRVTTIEPPAAKAAPNAAARIVALEGIVASVRSNRFVLRTRDGRLGVRVSAHTVFVGRLRKGAYVQVVGIGMRPDRARYVAAWKSPPPLLTVSGRIAASSTLGFSLDRAGSSSATIVVIASSTKTPPSLPVGEEVTVVGFGSAVRGIVATRISPGVASPSPSASPTASATANATPTATATPKPTATPSPTPTPQPTPTPRPTPTPTPMRGFSLQNGGVIGTDDLFTPPDGDTPSGGQSQMVDGIPCAPTMSENAYHVHVYLGLLVNGKQVAIPDQIGLYQPGPISDGYTNTAKCFYYIHTHDATGKIHIESPSTAPRNSSLFTLQNVLDVWGTTVNSNGVGPFQGPLRVFIGQAAYGSQYVQPSSYYEYFGDPNAIALYSHMAIWLEVGAPYYTASSLPLINFENEY
jgi:cell division septation protein DedD